MICAIAVVTKNLAIGKDGDQLYYIPGDLKRFKELTTGHTIVMGRKTFEALPNGALPNRKNIVLSRTKGLELPGCEVYNNLNDIISRVDEEIFIIGGEQIYETFLPYINTVYLTEIDVEREDATKFFPLLKNEEWEEETVSSWLKDEKNELNYRYIKLNRRI